MKQDTALDSSPNSNILDNITISPHDVYNVLIALDPNKAQVNDHISPKVWKIRATALHYPLYHLFAKCITNHLKNTFAVKKKCTQETTIKYLEPNVKAAQLKRK